MLVISSWWDVLWVGGGGGGERLTWHHPGVDVGDSSWWDVLWVGGGGGGFRRETYLTPPRGRCWWYQLMRCSVRGMVHESCLAGPTHPHCLLLCRRRRQPAWWGTRRLLSGAWRTHRMSAGGPYYGGKHKISYYIQVCPNKEILSYTWHNLWMRKQLLLSQRVRIVKVCVTQAFLHVNKYHMLRNLRDRLVLILVLTKCTKSSWLLIVLWIWFSYMHIQLSSYHFQSFNQSLISLFYRGFYSFACDL